jgi:hypothetical protein
MSGRSPVSKKRRGPIPTGWGVPVMVRLRPAQVDALDAWISRQGDVTISRPEAIRQILAVATGIAVEPPPTVDQQISDIEDRLSDVAVPKKPSPEKGMALLRKGHGENKLRKLKAQKRRGDLS